MHKNSFKYCRFVTRESGGNHSLLVHGVVLGLWTQKLIAAVERLEREQDPLLTPLHFRDQDGWFCSVRPFRTGRRLP